MNNEYKFLFENKPAKCQEAGRNCRLCYGTILNFAVEKLLPGWPEEAAGK
jgi:hypothetical protein